MKNSSVFLLIFFCFSFCACTKHGNEEELRARIAALKKENEHLRNKSKKLETSVSSYERTLKEIDFNLSKIELGLNLIENTRRGIQKEEPIEEKVKNHMELVQKLISNSTIKVKILDNNINDLRKLSGNQNSEILALDRELKESVRTLIEKQEEFDRRRELLNLDNTALEKIYQEQKAKTEELRKILDRAWFYVGTAKELKKNGIVDAEGGFVGIGRVKILNASASTQLFLQIEKENTRQKVVKSGAIKLISNHPKDSYRIERQGSKTVLHITNKKSFWQSGNYLIIQKD